MSSQYTRQPIIFLCHDSRDKGFVRKLAHDLQSRQIYVWLDEWEIRVGDSIIERIEHGISQADYLIAVISKNSIESRWVKEELNTALFTQITEGKIKVLPLLLEDCSVPPLIKKRRYADFRKEYSQGLDGVLTAIFPNSESKPLDPLEISVLRDVFDAGGEIQWTFTKEDRNWEYYRDGRAQAMNRLEKLGLLVFDYGGSSRWHTNRSCKLTEFGRRRAELLFKPKL